MAAVATVGMDTWVTENTDNTYRPSAIAKTDVIRETWEKIYTKIITKMTTNDSTDPMLNLNLHTYQLYWLFEIAMSDYILKDLEGSTDVNINKKERERMQKYIREQYEKARTIMERYRKRKNLEHDDYDEIVIQFEGINIDTSRLEGDAKQQDFFSHIKGKINDLANKLEGIIKKIKTKNADAESNQDFEIVTVYRADPLKPEDATKLSSSTVIIDKKCSTNNTISCYFKELAVNSAESDLATIYSESQKRPLSKGKQVEITTAIDKSVKEKPTISSFTKEREILKNTYDLDQAHKDAVAAASAAGGSKMNRKTRKKRK